MADTFFLLLLMLLLLLLLWLIGLSDKTTKNIHSHSMKVAMKEQVCVWVKGWGLGGGPIFVHSNTSVIKFILSAAMAFTEP